MPDLVGKVYSIKPTNSIKFCLVPSLVVHFSWSRPLIVFFLRLFPPFFWRGICLPDFFSINIPWLSSPLSPSLEKEPDSYIYFIGLENAMYITSLEGGAGGNLLYSSV